MNFLRTYLLLVFSIIIMIVGFGQIPQDSINSFKQSILDFRKGKNIKLMYSDNTPLTPEQHKNFKGLIYYDPDIKYCVKGELNKSEKPDTVVMRTSTERGPEYIEYGTIRFMLNGSEYRLKAYRSKKMLKANPNDSTLFIPFRDATNGSETYAGGRYVDCVLPNSGTMILLDFNKAYNPYCAYNPRFSCVIPPEENRLPFRIEAGEKTFEEHGN